jgi:hypothetical protein
LASLFSLTARNQEQNLQLKECPDLPKAGLQVAHFVNQFSCHYNNWVKLEGRREGLGVEVMDVAALREWNKVKKSWQELKVVIDHVY